MGIVINTNIPAMNHALLGVLTYEITRRKQIPSVCENYHKNAIMPNFNNKIKI